MEICYRHKKLRKSGELLRHTSCLKPKLSQGPEASQKILWMKGILIGKILVGKSKTLDCMEHLSLIVLYLQLPGTNFFWESQHCKSVSLPHAVHGFQ